MRRNLYICFLFSVTLFVSGAHSQDSTSTEPAIQYFSPANILRFADFLWKQGDYMRAAAEYQRYLYAFDKPSDYRTYYQLGRCYLRKNKPGAAVNYFKLAGRFAQGTAAQDTISAALTGATFLTKNNTLFNATVDSLKRGETGLYLHDYLLSMQISGALRNKDWNSALKNLQQPGAPNNTELFKSLHELAKRGATQPRKSPLAAALMSSVIPGSGKIYANRLFEGIYSFLLISGTGWLAYEGFRDDGVSSVKGWIFGSISFVLHTGNIYGSAVSVKVYNKKLEKTITDDVQVLIDFLTHF